MKNLIIGQGIAGTLLAFELLQRGEEVTIADNNHIGSSSLIAAGLWNPLSFRTIGLTWMFDQLFPVMEQVYPHLEELLGQSFYHPSKMIRIHSTAEEANLWSEKQNLPSLKPYLLDLSPRECEMECSMPFGAGQVNRAGFVDLPRLLNSAAGFFEKQGLLHQKNVDVANLWEVGQVVISGQAFDRIILCQGYKAMHDSPFAYLPFRVTRGELLRIECRQLHLKSLLNAGFFLKPLGDHQFLLGATFSQQPKDEMPTKEGKQELLDKFKKRFGLPIAVLEHKAGIRPNIADRRPVIGEHPEIKKLFIFNGMGSKAVMLTPYWAAKFAEALVEGKTLTAEVDVQRFVKRFRSSQ